MEHTEYTIKTDKISRDYTFVMLSDVHNKKENGKEALALTRFIAPDAIFVVGDLVDRHRKKCDYALSFIQGCSEIAPTYFSYGNHEIKFPVIFENDILKAGATIVLDNSFTFLDKSCEVVVGGQRPKAITTWLRDFEELSGFKILLDHHPEHYKEYLKDEHPEIDLILSAHAHGGQIRIFDRGILAPGQGFFPKYSKGLFDDRLIVGTGISNTGDPIPRLGNPTEIVVIHLMKA